MSFFEGHLLPHSIEAEQAVLGAVLLNPDSLYRIIDVLRPEDFYHESHQLIYRAFLELFALNQPVDLVTMVEHLKQKNLLEKAEGASYLASLLASVPTSANIEYYAKIVADKALLRGLIRVAGEIGSTAQTSNKEAREILDEAEEKIFSLAQKGQKSDFTPLKEVIWQSLDLLESRAKEGDNALPTFSDLDFLLSGLHRGELIICAARPGMGKTSFCLNIAKNTAATKNAVVGFFSLEMPKEQIVLRLLCSEAMVDQSLLRQNKLTSADWERLIKTASRLNNLAIFIDDSPSLNPLELKAKSRRLKAKEGLDLIIVDYIQLMRSSRRIENRQQEIAEISRSLKALARELEVPVLALSQLSRAVEQTQDKRPTLSHLRESGALEQDSDVVMFIHRPEYYDPQTDAQGIAEIIVAKQRNGPIGTIKMVFLPRFTKFVNLAAEEIA